MVIFSVAFTESYITRLFTRALPSLLAGNHPPFHLLVCTTENDRPRVEEELAKLNYPASIISIAFKGALNPANAVQISSFLLRQAVRHCLDHNEIFCAVCPDLIYAPDTLGNALTLHNITGKVVALFNGRVQLPEGCDHTQPPLSLFKQHMNAHWRENITGDEHATPGTMNGHQIYTNHIFRIWGSAPNPFLGRFQHEDVLLLAGQRGMRKWDHAWVQHLDTSNRLLVQTALRDGMSIEPEFGELPGLDPHEANDFAACPSREIARAAKFSGRTWCFTG